MRVQVDETRYQGMSGKLDSARSGVAAARLPGGEDFADAALGNDDSMILEDRLWRIDRNDPAGFYDENGGIGQAVLLGVCQTWVRQTPYAKPHAHKRRNRAIEIRIRPQFSRQSRAYQTGSATSHVKSSCGFAVSSLSGPLVRQAARK